MSFNSSNKRRHAGITVEVSLSIVLALGVLFLSLGIFGNNLKNMMANSNMQNMFNRANSDSKTANSAWAKDSTSSQVNVAMVGDQGLQAYHDQAVATIKALAEKTTPLTPEEITNLAEALTVKAESGEFARENGELDSYLAKDNIYINGLTTYKDLRDKYDIKTNFSSYKTIANGQTYNWNNDYIGESDLQSRVGNIAIIRSTFRR